MIESNTHKGLAPEELEDVFLEALERKMRAAVSMYVDALQVLQEVSGLEAVEAVRQKRLQRTLQSAAALRRELGEDSLVAYCAALETGCRFSHSWVKVQDSETCQEYRFVRCLWADVFRSLDAQEFGYWICEADGPAAAAFNPRIEFQRTRTLMLGDDCCDHCYKLKTS